MAGPGRLTHSEVGGLIEQLGIVAAEVGKDMPTKPAPVTHFALSALVL